MLAGAPLYVSPSIYLKLKQRENDKKDVEDNIFGKKKTFTLEERGRQDVFSFGLCLLEAGLQKDFQEIYDSDAPRGVNEKVLEGFIEEFKMKYYHNKDLCSI